MGTEDPEFWVSLRFGRARSSHCGATIFRAALLRRGVFSSRTLGILFGAALPLPSIVGNVPAGTLELDGGRRYESLHLSRAFGTGFEGGVGHLLEHFGAVSALGTFIFVDRHKTCIA